MDVDSNKNIFTWIASGRLGPNQTFYIPSKKAVEFLCAKVLNCKESDLKRVFKFDKPESFGFRVPPNEILRKSLRQIWCTSGSDIYKLFTIGSDHVKTKDGKQIKFVGTPVEMSAVGTDYYEGSYKIQYISGMILTGSMVSLLKNILKEHSGYGLRNENSFYRFFDNERNIFRKYEWEVGLPDKSYIPELLKELEVESIRDVPVEVMKILVLGEDVLRKHRMHDDEYQILFVSGTFEFGVVDILANSDSGQYNHFLFLNRYPPELVRKARNMIANLRGTAPVEKLYQNALEKIAQGGIKGRDLIALCGSSKEINKLCNSDDQAIFKRKLLEEFGEAFRWSEKVILRTGFQTPRELYRQMYKMHYCIVANSEDAVFDWARFPNSSSRFSEEEFIRAAAKNIQTEPNPWYLVTNEPPLHLASKTIPEGGFEVPEEIFYFEGLDDESREFSFLFDLENDRYYGLVRIEAEATEKELKDFYSAVKQVFDGPENFSGSMRELTFFEAVFGGKKYNFRVCNGTI